MIKIINKKIVVKFGKDKIEFSDEMKQKINAYWNYRVNENPYLFNGKNHCVESIKENDDTIEINITNSDYATTLYIDRIGYADSNIKFLHIWVGVLLETKDGYLVLGKMDDTTSVPGWLQIIGGGTSEEDVVDNTIDIDNALIRETKEEIDIDISNNYQLKFFEYPSEKRKVFGFIGVRKN